MTRSRSRAAAPVSVDAGGSASTGIGFVEPPPSSKGKYDWEAIASECKAKPGEWYKVFDTDRRSISTAVRQGSVRRLAPSLGFEVKTAHDTGIGSSPRTVSMWLRYVPSKDTTKRKKESK